MEFNIADAVVLGVLLLSGVLAFSRGFVREAMAILGWIGAAYAGLFLAPLIEPLLIEIPGVGGLLASSCSLGKLAAFSVGFAVALIVVSAFTPLLAGLVQSTPLLGPLDRAAGFVFGVARGAVLVAVAWLVYDLVVAPGDRPEIIETARSTTFIVETAAAVQNALPETVPAWITAPVDALMAPCGGVNLGGVGGGVGGAAAPDAPAPTLPGGVTPPAGD